MHTVEAKRLTDSEEVVVSATQRTTGRSEKSARANCLPFFRVAKNQEPTYVISIMSHGELVRPNMKDAFLYLFLVSIPILTLSTSRKSIRAGST